MMRRIHPWALLPACLLASLHANAADVVVHATRSGEALLVEASAEFEGTLERTWQVLTDYDRLGKFIPNMSLSRVTGRSADGIHVEQKGEARLLFWSYPIEVKLAVTEFPFDRVVSHAVGGNFREMSGTYTLESRGGRLRMRYSGRMVPAFYVPPLIGTWVLRNNVQATFGALVDEIVRTQRDGSATANDPR
jgi:hypothetical protein